MSSAFARATLDLSFQIPSLLADPRTVPLSDHSLPLVPELRPLIGPLPPPQLNFDFMESTDTLLHQIPEITA